MAHLRRSASLALIVSSFLLCRELRAQEGAPPAKSFEMSAGLLGLVGGNFVTTPSEIPGGYEGLGFAGDAGGFGYGVAAYGEGRFLRHLGLGVTLGYDQSTIQREVTYNGTVKVDEKLSIGSTRLGLMAKGVLPTPFGRLWLGLGPQFVLSSSAEAKNEITTNRAFVPNPEQVEGLIHAEETSSTLLDFGGGLAIHAGDLIEIPFEIRASRNLSQEDAWQDRVTLRVSGNTLTGYDVKAQSSWEFRMGLGVGARF
jgi:hypothetical protein